MSTNEGGEGNGVYTVPSGTQFTVRFVDLIAYWPILTTAIVVSSAAGVQLFFAKYGLNGFYIMGAEDYVATSVMGTFADIVILGSVYGFILTLAVIAYIIISGISLTQKAKRGSFRVLEAKRWFLAFGVASVVLVLILLRNLYFIKGYIDWLCSPSSKSMFSEVPVIWLSELNHERVDFRDIGLLYGYAVLLGVAGIAVAFGRIGRTIGMWLFLIGLVLGPALGSFIYFDVMHNRNYQVDVAALIQQAKGVRVQQGADDNTPESVEWKSIAHCESNNLIWSGAKALVLHCQGAPKAVLEAPQPGAVADASEAKTLIKQPSKLTQDTSALIAGGSGVNASAPTKADASGATVASNSIKAEAASETPKVKTISERPTCMTSKGSRSLAGQFVIISSPENIPLSGVTVREAPGSVDAKSGSFDFFKNLSGSIQTSKSTQSSSRSSSSSSSSASSE